MEVTDPKNSEPNRCCGCGEVIPPGFNGCNCTSEATEELDIVHLRLKDGRCVISVNGQGHFPCEEHPKVKH